MGNVVKANVWTQAGSSLNNISQQLINMIPVVDQWVAQDQTKNALDAYVKKTQEIKDEFGNKTDAATQLFSVLFKYDPEKGDPVDEAGLALAQEALNIVQDAVLSKDVEGMQQGLNEVKDKIMNYASQLKKTQGPLTQQGAAVSQFAQTLGTPEGQQAGLQQIRTAGFRGLQERQQQQEALQKQLAGARQQISAQFPRGRQAIEKFGTDAVSAKDFNKQIADYLRTKEESELAKARTKQADAATKLSNARKKAADASVKIDPATKLSLDVLKIEANKMQSDINKSIEMLRLVSTGDLDPEEVGTIKQIIASMKFKDKQLGQVISTMKEIAPRGRAGVATPEEIQQKISSEKRALETINTLKNEALEDQKMIDELEQQIKQKEEALMKMQTVKGFIKQKFGFGETPEAVAEEPSAEPVTKHPQDDIVEQLGPDAQVQVRITDSKGKSIIKTYPVSKWEELKKQAEANNVTLQVIK